MDIHVGYGLCEFDFTIKEKELAVFQDLKDAQEFIKNKYYNSVMLSYKIFYFQEAGKDRQIFVPDKNEFVSGEEIISGKTKVYVPGWEIGAEFYNPEEDWEDYQTSVCIGHDNAEKIKMEYLDDGASKVDISEIDVDVQMQFWKTDEFFKGSPQSRLSKEADMTQTEVALKEMYKHRSDGATIYSMVGDALEKIDTEDILNYFSDKIMGRKDLIRKKIMGGENLIRNYLQEQITADEINKNKYRNMEQ
ncbi:MAG: hypothetical protein ACI4L2_08290 [Wujia sp.]